MDNYSRVKIMIEEKQYHTANCMLCAAPLLYSQTSIEKKCEICLESQITNVFCENDHFICDICHQADAMETIESFCAKTDLKDPIEILEKVMQFPQIKMHGPEHHFLVPAAIVTALKNNGHLVSKSYLREIKLRATKVPGGTCGFWGTCGAAVGVGIAFSVFFHASPKTKKERKIALHSTSVALDAIADGTEQCCKRASRLAIETACDLLASEHGIKIPCNKSIPCDYTKINPRCNLQACSFYNPA